MTSTTKVVLGIIVIIVLGIAVLFWTRNPGTPETTATDDSTALPSGSDTSDAALEQDQAAIGASLDQANSDSAQADQSVSAESSGSDF